MNTKFRCGTRVQAIDNEDMIWRTATIQEITDTTVKVVFDGFSTNPAVAMEIDSELVTHFNQWPIRDHDSRDDSCETIVSRHERRNKRKLNYDHPIDRAVKADCIWINPENKQEPCNPVM